MAEKVFLKNKNYSKLKKVLKYIALAAVYYALLNCPLVPQIFAYAAFCCAAYLLLNPLISYVLLISIAFALNPSISFLLTLPLSAGVFLIVLAGLKLFKKRLKPLVFVIIAVLCNLTNAYAITSGQDVLNLALSCLYIFLSIVVILNTIKVPLQRKGIFNLTTDEIVCLCLITVAVFSGLNNVKIFDVSILNIVGITFILVLMFSLKLNYALVFSVLLGLSTALTGNYQFLGLYVLFALMAAIFKETSKYLSALSLVLTEIILAYFFNFYQTYSYINLIFIGAGCLIFLVIPNKVFEKISFKFLQGERQLSRIIVNRNRQKLYLRVIEISNVFREMENIFTKMQKGFMSKTTAAQMLSKECLEKVCSLCENYNNCIKNKETLLNSICTAIEHGIDKGKIAFIDIPEGVAKNCINTPKLIATFNQYANSYRQYITVMEKMDSSRKLIGRQLGGVSNVIKEVANEVKGSVSFDYKTEKVILDEFLFNNIMCSEAVIYTDGKEPTISLIVDKNDAEDERLAQIVSKALKIPMIVYLKEETNQNQTAIFLKCSPKYDVVFGAAGCPKYQNELSGDTHSLLRIADDKFMVALCDGMGSGSQAENMSSATISLIENFYRAGLTSDLILDSVNNLLAISADEIFAALDICVCDLNKGHADFIKLGAPNGYIKTAGKTEVISGNSLPMGILEETAPSVFNCAIENKSFIVLCTDGITESFKENGLKELINDFSGINPQELAEYILKTALDAVNGKAKDDMTVLTLRIFTKV